jgi:hypothetical protein
MDLASWLTLISLRSLKVDRFQKRNVDEKTALTDAVVGINSIMTVNLIAHFRWHKGRDSESAQLLLHGLEQAEGRGQLAVCPSDAFSS